MGENHESLQAATEAVSGARAILITAGAGIGVDSGLPDFRGDRGFWNAYPPFERLGLSFVDLANPEWFVNDPALAWGFYGHRLQLYRSTVPHDGFGILREWMNTAAEGAFVFTSNVDGQFQQAGFPAGRIVECHGSIHVWQCLRQCGVGLFPGDAFTVRVDATSMRAHDPLPRCPRCGALARPNILMFGDWEWDETRTAEQQERLTGWLRGLTSAPIVVECGAGPSIPTVRRFGEDVVRRLNGVLVRINPRDAGVPRDLEARGAAISVPLGTLKALTAMKHRQKGSYD